jgi:hypothetical protein
VMVRPEQISWQTAPDGSLDNMAEALVCKSAFLGMYTQLVVELQNGLTVTLHQAGESETSGRLQNLVGQRVFIGWKAQNGQVLLD